MLNPEPISSQPISSQGEREDRGEISRAIPSAEKHETAAEREALLDFAEKVSANIGTLEILQRRYMIRGFVFVLLTFMILLPGTILLPNLLAATAVETEMLKMLFISIFGVSAILGVVLAGLSTESYLVWKRTRNKLSEERALMAQLIRTLSKRVEERDTSSTRQFIFEERLRRLSFKGDRWYTTLP